MNKIRKILALGIFDILVSIPFIASSWWIWDYLGRHITANAWGPLQIAIFPQMGQTTSVGATVPLPNYPFILFWIALVGNFVIFILALRSSDKKQSSG